MQRIYNTPVSWLFTNYHELSMKIQEERNVISHKIDRVEIQVQKGATAYTLPKIGHSKCEEPNCNQQTSTLAKLSPKKGGKKKKKNVCGSSNRLELSFKRLIAVRRWFRLLAGETRVFGQTSRHFYPAEGRLQRAHLPERREKFISYLGAGVSPRVESLATDSNSSTLRDSR